MKIKALVIAALIGTVGLSSAHAGIHFGFSIGLPVPVVVAPPVVVAGPAYPYAYPGYAYAPGYWSVGVGGRFWVPGGWHYGGGGYWHGGWHGGWHHH